MEIFVCAYLCIGFVFTLFMLGAMGGFDGVVNNLLYDAPPDVKRRMLDNPKYLKIITFISVAMIIFIWPYILIKDSFFDL